MKFAILYFSLFIRKELLFAATATCVYFSLKRKVTKVQGYMVFAKKLVLPAMKWSRSFHFTSSLHFLSIPPPIFLNANLMRPFSHHTSPWACAIGTGLPLKTMHKPFLGTEMA